ncbi:MAG: NAD(P)H-hydrate dehydratase [Rhodobacterales bacterium]|nr:NAD(P)H-hydrate dehydratase [Rhodobacterales bacterium]
MPRRFVMTRPLQDMLRKATTAHKYGHGHALVLTGGAGRSGAARLAGRGALRIGAGLVTLAVPPDALAEVASRITALMMQPLPDAAALAALLTDTRYNALCLGPGLGLEDRHAALVKTALAARRATVLDADALTVLSHDTALMGALHPACVLTPHEGEFARLFPDLAAALHDDPEARAATLVAAAARAGCTVLLKGPATLVAGPDGQASIHPTDPDGALAWLATAGSGDVLAGFITGLIARGLTPRLAADMAVWLHRAAAREAGPGLIAEDLPEALPPVFRAMGL